jgi:preprotein translocase subunit SecE
MADLEKKESEAVEAAEDVKETAKTDSKDKKSKKAAPKKNKPGFFKRIGKFFKDYKSELKKVVWLNPKTTAQYTGLVLVVMVIVSAFIFGLDVIFNQLLEWLSKLV